MLDTSHYREIIKVRNSKRTCPIWAIPSNHWLSQPTIGAKSLYECKILKIDWLYLEISIQPSLRHPTMVKTDMSDLRNSIQPLTEPANHWNNTIIISLRLSREPYIVERNGCHFWSHLTTSWMLMLDTSHYTEIMKIVLYITLYVRLFQFLENHGWLIQPLTEPANHWEESIYKLWKLIQPLK